LAWIQAQLDVVDGKLQTSVFTRGLKRLRWVSASGEPASQAGTGNPNRGMPAAGAELGRAEVETPVRLDDHQSQVFHPASRRRWCARSRPRGFRVSTTSFSRLRRTPSGASNQVHLQGLHALKAGITGDHHGIRAQLQATSSLQGIWSAQPMVGAQLCRQFNDCGVQFDNQQIRLGKQRLKTIDAGLITPAQRRYTTLQKTEAAYSKYKTRGTDGKLLQGGLSGFDPRGLAIHQVDQCAGIEEGNHQLRSAVSSASISALLRGFADGGRASSHSSADASLKGARDACN